MLATKGSNRLLYLFSGWGIVEIDKLIGYLVDFLFYKLKVMIRLIDSNIGYDIRRRFSQLRTIFTFLLPLHLINPYHNNLLLTFFILPIHQHTIIFDFIPLIPSYALNHKYIILTLQYPMRYLQDDWMFRDGGCILELIVVEKEIVFDLVERPEPVGLSLRPKTIVFSR